MLLIGRDFSAHIARVPAIKINPINIISFTKLYCRQHIVRKGNVKAMYLKISQWSLSRKKILTLRVFQTSNSPEISTQPDSQVKVQISTRWNWANPLDFQWSFKLGFKLRLTSFCSDTLQQIRPIKRPSCPEEREFFTTPDNSSEISQTWPQQSFTNSIIGKLLGLNQNRFCQSRSTFSHYVS